MTVSAYHLTRECANKQQNPAEERCAPCGEIPDYLRVFFDDLHKNKTAHP